MSKIEAILFDVGGVLLTNGWDHAERAAVLTHFSVDRAAYEKRHELANDAWEKGLMTAEQFLERTVFFEARPFTPADFLDEMKAQSRELADGGMHVLKELRSSGKVQLSVLNNEARELNDYRIDRFQLRTYFDAFFCSCYLGLRKPDPKIFQLALDVLGKKASNVAFIDDREENCAAAESLGLRAIRFESGDQLRRELDGLGILSRAQA